jgi:membrane-bound lytic murein transglycosylase B
MSENGRLHTIRVPLRRVCAVLPAVALLGAGLAFSAPATSAPNPTVVAVADDSPVVVVPDTALTVPSGAGIFADRAEGLKAPEPMLPAARTPAALLPAGSPVNGSAMVTLDSTGIPVRALEAYRTASSLVNAADPGCHIDWALVAAIGRVESNHARFGGNQLDNAGVARPGIIGIALDGSNGTARITDSDGGLLDRDTVYDRAVGPMQFIPGTWRVSGVDANDDGVKNPQDMADAAAATAVYLCSGPGDLKRPGDLRSAILRYNASDSYVKMVSSIANAYRQGVTALPASDLAPARPTALVPRTSRPATKPATATRAAATPRKATPAIAKAKAAPAAPVKTTATAKPASPTSTSTSSPSSTSTTSSPTSTPPTTTSTTPPSPEPTSTAPACEPTPVPTITGVPDPTDTPSADPACGCVPAPSPTGTTPSEACAPASCLATPATCPTATP